MYPFLNRIGRMGLFAFLGSTKEVSPMAVDSFSPMEGVVLGETAEADDSTITKPPLPVTEDIQRAVKSASDWFRDDKDAKAPVLLEWSEMEKLRRSDHWSLLRADGEPIRSADEQRLHPNTVENVTFSLIEGQASEFCKDIDLVDIPVEDGDDEAATVLTDLKKAIAEKNEFEQEGLDWNRNFFWLGSAIWEHVWDPEWTGGRGPNRWVGEVKQISLDPYHFYPDARCRKRLSEGNRCHKASRVTLEYLKDRYPDTAGNVQSEILDTTSDGDDDDATRSNTGATDASSKDTTLLIETWYIGEPLIKDQDGEGSGKGLHVIWWAGEGQRVYLKHANYVYPDAGSKPAFPFTFRWRYPRRNSLWGYGEAYYLRDRNVSLNKHAEMILEGNMAAAFGKTYFTQQGMDEQQQKYAEENGGLPGIHIPVNDVNHVKTVYGQAMSAGVQAECDRLNRGMEAQIGRFDVNQGRTPGSVTAFAAIDALAKNARVRLISAELAQRTAYQDMARYVNHLITTNYTETRAYRIVGKSPGDEPPKRGNFSVADIQKVHFPQTGTVIPFKGWTPPQGAVEGQDYEIYTPEMDVYCRVSSVMPSDRLVFMEMAKELYAGQVIGPETLLYVIDKGKFPPIEQLLADVQKMQTAAAPPQAAPPPPKPPAIGLAPVGGINFNVSSKDPEVVMATLQQVSQQMQAQQQAPMAQGQAVGGLPPELQAELAQLPPEEQEAVLERILQGMEGGEPPAMPEQ